MKLLTLYEAPSLFTPREKIRLLEEFYDLFLIKLKRSEDKEEKQMWLDAIKWANEFRVIFAKEALKGK